MDFSNFEHTELNEDTVNKDVHLAEGQMSLRSTLEWCGSHHPGFINVILSVPLAQSTRFSSFSPQSIKEMPSPDVEHLFSGNECHQSRKYLGLRE